jgi:hypothetical protein
LLFTLLACDSLIYHRVRWVRSRHSDAADSPGQHERAVKSEGSA